MTEPFNMRPNPLPITPGDTYLRSQTWVTVVDGKGTESPWDDEVIARGRYIDSELNLETGKETVTLYDILLDKELTIDHSDSDVVVQIDRAQTNQDRFKIDGLRECVADTSLSKKQKEHIYYSVFPGYQYKLTKIENALKLESGLMNKFSQAHAEIIANKAGTEIYPGAEKFDASDIVKKYIDFLNGNMNVKVSEIQALIKEEDDKDIKKEYQTLIDEIKEDAELYLKENFSSSNTTKENFENISELWPTLLNPSPFHT